MKILLILLLPCMLLAQPSKNSASQAQADTTNARLDVIHDVLQDVEDKVTRPTTITNGTVSVTSSAVQVIVASTPSKWVVLTNNSSGTAYWGASGVTTSTGEPLNPKMQVWIPIDNANKIYVIGDPITLRYKILN